MPQFKPLIYSVVIKNLWVYSTDSRLNMSLNSLHLYIHQLPEVKCSLSLFCNATLPLNRKRGLSHLVQWFH